MIPPNEELEFARDEIAAWKRKRAFWCDRANRHNGPLNDPAEWEALDDTGELLEWIVASANTGLGMAEDCATAIEEAGPGSLGAKLLCYLLHREGEEELLRMEELEARLAATETLLEFHTA